ncbi:hypothetical protein BDB01DRAFT_714241 [Pilobolus umbonatus]|nr:hypothetical protein BDB01DRAFT_714241 [Pilobolus umbonatus]
MEHTSSGGVADIERRKGSVTFDLPPVTMDNELLSPASPIIDIAAQLIPDTMLVALFDRENEMKDLVKFNRNYFLSVQSYLGLKWNRFIKTLFFPRAEFPDSEWMKRISNALKDSPILLEKFKELVGYIGDDTADSDSNDNYFSNAKLAKLRNCPEKLSKKAYPQFFINCENTFENATLYNEFVDLLLHVPESEIPDDIWETKVLDLLQNWPNILEQLQEIVAYETEED